MSFIKIGKIHSAQGLKGQLFLFVFAKEWDWLPQIKEFGLSGPESSQPEKFFVLKKAREHQKEKKKGLALELLGIQNRNQAEELIGQSVYIPEELLQSEEGENIYLREILGFRVLDQARGDLGPIKGFSGNGAQDLLVLDHIQGEFMVPLVEPILQSIDFDQKKVFMDIPQGLVPGEDL